MTTLFFLVTIIILNLFLTCLIFLSKNPIYSIISFVGVIVCYSIYLIFLELDFLAFTLLVVYVGAIMVLFLFVMMMLNIKTFESSGNLYSYALLTLSTLVFFFLLFYFYNTDLFNFFPRHSNPIDYFSWASVVDTPSVLNSISLMLYEYYFFEVFVIAFLLLVAMMGSIVLTLLPKTHIKKQKIFAQIERDSLLSIKLVSLP